MLCLWSRRGVWGNSDAELAVKQEAPHLREGRSHRDLRVGIYRSVNGGMRYDRRGFDRSAAVFEPQFVDARAFESFNGAGKWEALATAPALEKRCFAALHTLSLRRPQTDRL